MNISGSGYEIGPIRPPSEAESLLLRITRNCPWNRCAFCSLYKGKKFSPRSVEEVKQDIDQLKECIDLINEGRRRTPEYNLPEEAWYMAEHWLRGGMKSVFLQDANSLVIKPERMTEILKYLREVFPGIKRITTYGRSQTVSRISDEDLSAIAGAGLNRIHIGMESACDRVLELVKKGVTKEEHITAGRKIKRTAIELSEYYMPGLGGTEYAECNAVETADAVNSIDPDFIRIRTTVVTAGSEMARDYEAGLLHRSNDVRTAEELLLFIKNLEGISGCLKNDHIINLLPEVQGRFPGDKQKMTDTIETFLNLPQEEQMIFRIGRRTGIMALLKGLENKNKRQAVINIIKKNDIDAANIDYICDSLMQRYI